MFTLIRWKLGGLGVTWYQSNDTDAVAEKVATCLASLWPYTKDYTRRAIEHVKQHETIYCISVKIVFRCELI